MDRGAWRVTVRGAAKSLTRLKRLSTHNHFHKTRLSSDGMSWEEIKGGERAGAGVGTLPGWVLWTRLLGKVFPKGATWAGPAWSERPELEPAYQYPAEGRTGLGGRHWQGRAPQWAKRGIGGGLSGRPGPDNTGPTGHGGRLGTLFWGGHPARTNTGTWKGLTRMSAEGSFWQQESRHGGEKHRAGRRRHFSEQRWWWRGARVVFTCS